MSAPERDADVEPFTSERCSCKPWEQTWRADEPDWCANCGLPFTSSAGRECCLKTPTCLLLPGHDGECSS